MINATFPPVELGPTPAQLHDLLLVSVVVGFLSLWGSSVIVNAFFVFGKGRGFAIMVLFLALGDFVWSLATVGSALVLLVAPDVYMPGPCVFFRILYQFGAFSSLIWGLGILLFILRCGRRRRSLVFVFFSHL